MQTRSSSNRVSAGVCDAVVVKSDNAVGPVRLPENRADDFVDHFNRTYRGLGMTLKSLNEPDVPKKIPGSPKTAGDHVSGSSG